MAIAASERAVTLLIATQHLIEAIRLLHAYSYPPKREDESGRGVDALGDGK